MNRKARDLATMGLVMLPLMGCIGMRDPSRADPPNFTATYAVPFMTLAECTFGALQANGYRDVAYAPLPTQGKASIDYAPGGGFFLDIIRLSDTQSRVIAWNDDLVTDMLTDGLNASVIPCAGRSDAAPRR